MEEWEEGKHWTIQVNLIRRNYIFGGCQKGVCDDYFFFLFLRKARVAQGGGVGEEGDKEASHQ